MAHESNHLDENKNVIRQFLEDVINQGRLERTRDLVAKDFIELDPLPGQRQGREGLAAVIAMLLAAFPDMHWTADEMVAEADTVVTRFTWTGTHCGPFMGIPATHHPVTVKGVVIDQLAHGKMQKSRILMDNLSLMQQLGVISTS
jgi:steroid delta-isomerase-like uncharacterized protein